MSQTNEQKTYFRIDKRVAVSGERAWTWQPMVSGYETEDEAQLAFADARRFPLDTKYRVVKVIEEVVFQ